MKAGQIHKNDELILLFNESKVFLNSDDYVLPLSCLDLSLEIEKFTDGTAWKVRVLSYDEERCELMTEIIDYAEPELNNSKQSSTSFSL